MAMPDFPDDILVKIVKLVANDRWWLLGPILKAGRRGKKLAYNGEVLKNVNIYTLCQDPGDIFTYQEFNTGIQQRGRYRFFFERCLEAGNKTAIYYEGLRIVTEVQDIHRGIELISQNVPEDADATLACGLFSICVGSEEMAIHYLNMFGERHHCLGSEEVRHCGEDFVRELSYYKRMNNNTYKSSFKFPMCDSIPSPECAMECAVEYGPYDILCKDCYLWWLAREVCHML